jgi:hypothetical protein
MADPNDGGKIDDRKFQVIVSALDDCRRLIAAGKVQRWEVVKWGVAVNVALATAAAAVQLEQNVRLVLFVLAVAVSIASLSLVKHYNKRMTGARKTSTTIVNRLKPFHIDYDAILKTDVVSAYSVGENYDCQELITFSTILIMSPILVLLKDIVSAATIADSMAHAIGWVSLALVVTLFSEILVCFSSRARATKINTFLRRHATAIRRFDVIAEIISIALLVIAASAILHP